METISSCTTKKREKKKKMKKLQNFIIDTEGDHSESIEHAGTEVQGKKLDETYNTEKISSKNSMPGFLKERELVADLFGSDISDSSKTTLPQSRKAAWIDEDDEHIKLCDVAARLTKSKKIDHSRDTSQTSFQEFLKDSFSRVFNSNPEWANLDRPLQQNDEDDDNIQFERSVGLNLGLRNSSVTLPSHILNFKSLKDLNGESRAEGTIISSIQFHHEHQVALVAGSNFETLGCASLFKVDGVTNPKIQSIKFPKFPIKCARFLPDGKRFIAGSNASGSIFIYDMEAGKQSKIPYTRERKSVKDFEVSNNGQLVVCLGSHGNIYVFDAKTLGHIHTLQVPGEVRALAFNQEGTQLFTHGDQGKVFVFDMATRSCVHGFNDDGCIEGTSLAVSPNNRLLACGSFSGIVNLYETSDLVNNQPKPVKVVDNLVTKVKDLAFNESSEMLALCSKEKLCAIKLLHIPTLSIFKNFPAPNKNYFQRIQNVAFSPKGGYLAAGNNKGSALLFRLSHYSSY